MAGEPKDEAAFRTIGELAAELGLPQHILRYWETRFPQLRPLTRAGNRRYYRPDDVALVRRIDQALNREGYTIRGAQMLLSGEGSAPAVPPPVPRPKPADDPALRATLVQLRDRLAAALGA